MSVTNTSTPYTLAKWHVRVGQEAAFIAAWERLAAVFSSLPAPPRWGTLLQSVTDSTVFFSFGPWRTMEDVAAMREDVEAQQAIEAVRALCVEATPAAYQLVKHVEVASE